jgi:glutaredoxin-related protein
MTKEKRDAIFEKAGTRVTPLLFIDDEFVGDYAKVMDLNESGKLHKMLEY